MRKGLVHKNDLVKVLGNGELKVGLTVVAHKYSTAAKEKIESNGGSITLV